MPNDSNNNRENNKGCLDELLEIFFEGIMALFIEIIAELSKWLIKAVGVIIAIGFLIYFIVTFLINHA